MRFRGVLKRNADEALVVEFVGSRRVIDDWREEVSTCDIFAVGHGDVAGLAKRRLI